MSKIYYPFSQNPQENSAPHENILIYKRYFTLENTDTKVINSIEIDLRRFKLLCPDIENTDIEKISGSLLESIFGIDVQIIENYLKSGKTTRLLDRWIQEFFEKGITYIYEGRDNDNQKVLNQEALNRFKRRMDSEHNDIDFKYEHGVFSGISCFKVTKK